MYYELYISGIPDARHIPMDPELSLKNLPVDINKYHANSATVPEAARQPACIVQTRLVTDEHHVVPSLSPPQTR